MLLVFQAGYRVHICDPAITKHILVTNSTNFHRNKGVKLLLPALGSSLFAADGKLHAIQRKHLNPEFSLANVQKYVPIFNSKAKELMQVFYYDVVLQSCKKYRNLGTKFPNNSKTWQIKFSKVSLPAMP